MIPLQDLTPRRSFPAVTLLLILANTIVFLYQFSLPPHAADAFIMTYGVYPQNSDGPGREPLHAATGLPSALHLHVSARRLAAHHRQHVVSVDFWRKRRRPHGPHRLLAVYLVCGIGSSVAQTLFSWGSHIPSLGASGAISGVLGAYIVFFPSSQISTLFTLFILWFRARVPALVFIGLWFAMQFLNAIGSLGTTGRFAPGGIAVWAHVGGFLLGMLIAFIMSLSTRGSARF